MHTLLRLPTGIFYAQGVKANVLFFDKKPADGKVHTKGVWIYDLCTNRHFTLKTRPLGSDDLSDFINCYRPANRHERKEGERFRYFTHADLVARDKASLDICLSLQPARGARPRGRTWYRTLRRSPSPRSSPKRTAHRSRAC